MKHIIAVAITAIVISAIFLIPGKTTTIQYVYTVTAGELPHRQEVWVHALEWCESRAINEAVNENDLDGTPSYYNWQFKPGTFKAMGERYGIIEKGKTNSEIMELLKSYELQHKIVNAMVKDAKNINWEQTFPACVARLGRPPL
jgi:hypothetical protein